jgi:hypothetical protein
MARLLSGRVESEKLSDAVLAHLVARCPECRASRQELESLRHAVGHWSYLVAITEGIEAPVLWTRLAALPYAEQLLAVEREPAFQTWGLCRLLLRLSEQAACSEPPMAPRLRPRRLARGGVDPTASSRSPKRPPPASCRLSRTSNGREGDW